MTELFQYSNRLTYALYVKSFFRRIRVTLLMPIVLVISVLAGIFMVYESEVFYMFFVGLFGCLAIITIEFLIIALCQYSKARSMNIKTQDIKFSDKGIMFKVRGMENLFGISALGPIIIMDRYIVVYVYKKPMIISPDTKSELANLKKWLNNRAKYKKLISE